MKSKMADFMWHHVKKSYLVEEVQGYLLDITTFHLSYDNGLRVIGITEKKNNKIPSYSK